MALDYSEISGILVLILLLTCSALMSGSEVALFSLKATDFPESEDDYTPKQKILLQLLKRPQRLLATILVANTFVNIAIVILLDNLTDKLLADVEVVLFAVDMRFVLKVVVATFFLVLFGEILPKIYANRKNVQFANSMAQPLLFLNKTLGVFSLPMRAMTKGLQSRLGHKKSGVSVDQLSWALDLTDERDTSEEEQEILQSIVLFGNIDTKQVMQPRTDIFAVELGQPFKEILPEIVDHGYSRIPVYQDSLDHVEGILYVKDLLPYMEEKDLDWEPLMREPYFVPENKKLDDLLSEFKLKKIHLAIVVDEYGGTSGLITMEDVIEEIVGEISDEFDEEDFVFSKLDDKTYVFEGKTPLVDFYKITELEDSSSFEEHKGDAETIAGFLLEISGDFPKAGEEIKFEHYTFTVEVVDEKRIKQVKFHRQ